MKVGADPIPMELSTNQIPSTEHAKRTSHSVALIGSRRSGADAFSKSATRKSTKWSGTRAHWSAYVTLALSLRSRGLGDEARAGNSSASGSK